MRGILEKVLVDLNGPAEIVEGHPFREKRWNSGGPDCDVLYFGTDWTTKPAVDLKMHKALYGDACGGFLAGNSLKVAMLSSRTVFGLYTIEELLALPPVQRARELDAAVQYFMDAANVWYYGHKNGGLFVYDVESDEVDELGPLEKELLKLIEEWRAAT
jgi:hypothetical protein